jgi:exopolysaccharide biosynthesis polyprenyl glycosylphosphotransferase
MDASKQLVLRRLTLLLDVLVLPLSGVLAFRFHEAARSLLPSLREAVDSSAWALLVYVAVPLWVLLVLVMGFDRSFEQRWTAGGLLARLVQLHAVWFLGLTGVAFLTNGIINRTIVALLLLINLGLTWLVHMAVGAWVARRYERGEARQNWLLVGAPSETLRAFVRDASDEPFAPRIAGMLTVGPPAADLPALRGPPESLGGLLHAGSIDRVVFFPPLNSPEQAGPLLRACELHGTPASFVVDFGQAHPVPPTVERVGDRPCITYEWVAPRRGGLVLKSLFDALAASTAIVCLAPLLAAIALAVRISMGKPVLFGQERAGLNGRRFRMWKFRTMVPDAEAQRLALASRNEMSGPVFKLTEDPRVTRLGRFLRRWSLDELPQFFNVLSGEMSLVGPRPLPLHEQHEIEGWYRRRLSMKPGITGLWQVSGRNTVDFDDWMRLDLRYVDQWSLGLDLKLLLMTIPAVLSRRGAT